MGMPCKSVTVPAAVIFVRLEITTTLGRGEEIKLTDSPKG